MIAESDLYNTLEFAVVIPTRNEAENIGPLVEEIAAAFTNSYFEIIIVNDGSDDSTSEVLSRIGPSYPQLRIVTHERASGQSAAIVSGIRTASANTIITMDGDRQNVPADAPKLLDLYLLRCLAP